MSYLTCHMSCVTCHVSHVTCNIFLFFLDNVVKLIGGGSVIKESTPSSFYIRWISMSSELNYATYLYCS